MGIGTQTYKTLTWDSGLSNEKLQKTFYVFLEQASIVKIIKRDYIRLRIDAKYFKQFCLLCYQYDVDGYIQLFRFTYDEHYEGIKKNLDNLIRLGLRLESITTDGRKRILKTIRMVVPQVIIQRCLIHNQRMCLLWLTRYQKHQAGKEFAKTVIIKIDGKMAMTVLPASYQLNFKLLHEIFGTQQITLATEAEFKYAFPDCDVGAMPPFGNLYDMEVFVAESLAEDENIAFNAGNHTETIKLKYVDFERLVHPRVFRFSQKTVSLPYDPSERWIEDY